MKTQKEIEKEIEENNSLFEDLTNDYSMRMKAERDNLILQALLQQNKEFVEFIEKLESNICQENCDEDCVGNIWSAEFKKLKSSIIGEETK